LKSAGKLGRKNYL